MKMLKDSEEGIRTALVAAEAVANALEPVAALAQFPAPTCTEHPQCALAGRLRDAAIVLDGLLRELLAASFDQQSAKRGGVQ